VTIGNGAFVAAGSVITDDVSDDALAIARGRQAEMPGRAARMRDERGTVESATASQESEPKPTKTADVNAPRPKRRKTG
jgi:bifunctional UDP-N-acetylglucosamine pyrophosphorylase/glucosamine-1-phosphate N-acetyltransferase